MEQFKHAVILNKPCGYLMAEFNLQMQQNSD